MGQVAKQIIAENNNGVINTEINQIVHQGLYFMKVTIGSYTQIVKISVQ
jgi:hypothetical protein